MSISPRYLLIMVGLFALSFLGNLALAISGYRPGFEYLLAAFHLVLITVALGLYRVRNRRSERR